MAWATQRSCTRIKVRLQTEVSYSEGRREAPLALTTLRSPGLVLLARAGFGAGDGFVHP